jgi:hypothetical protein
MWRMGLFRMKLAAGAIRTFSGIARRHAITGAWRAWVAVLRHRVDRHLERRLKCLGFNILHRCMTHHLGVCARWRLHRWQAICVKDRLKECRLKACLYTLSHQHYRRSWERWEHCVNNQMRTGKVVRINVQRRQVLSDYWRRWHTTLLRSQEAEAKLQASMYTQLERRTVQLLKSNAYHRLCRCIFMHLQRQHSRLLHLSWRKWVSAVEHQRQVAFRAQWQVATRLVAWAEDVICETLGNLCAVEQVQAFWKWREVVCFERHSDQRHSINEHKQHHRAQVVALRTHLQATYARLLCQCNIRWQRRRCRYAWKRWVSLIHASRSAARLLCSHLAKTRHCCENDTVTKSHAVRTWQRVNMQQQRTEVDRAHCLQLEAVAYAARETVSKLQSYMRAWSSWQSFMRCQLIAAGLLARRLHCTQTSQLCCALQRWRRAYGV